MFVDNVLIFLLNKFLFQHYFVDDTFIYPLNSLFKSVEYVFDFPSLYKACSEPIETLNSRRNKVRI